MREYGLDGVFVQRFAGEVSHPAGLQQFYTVLSHCREGANLSGRTYEGLPSDHYLKIVSTAAKMISG